MNISWNDAQTFLAIAEGGSISAGAQRLGLGQPTVSRRVALLEGRLGCALFVRGKQGVRLTEAGVRLRPAAEQMARWAGEFERLARGAEAEAVGVVRVAAPPGIAFDLLPLVAADLRRDFPALRLEVRASVAHVDLPRGEADLAIRTRAPNEPELTSLASGTRHVGVFASHDYASALAARRRAGGRDGPIALADLDWISWSAPLAHVPPRPLLERVIPDFSPVFASDDYLVQRSAVRAGLGAMVLDAQGATEGGDEHLIELDLGLALPPNTFHLVCAKSMQFVPRLRVVADRLIAAVQAEEAPRSTPPQAPSAR